MTGEKSSRKAHVRSKGLLVLLLIPDVSPSNKPVHDIDHARKEHRVKAAENRAEEVDGATVDEERGDVERKVEHVAERDGRAQLLLVGVVDHGDAGERKVSTTSWYSVLCSATEHKAMPIHNNESGTTVG